VGSTDLYVVLRRVHLRCNGHDGLVGAFRSGNRSDPLSARWVSLLYPSYNSLFFCRMGRAQRNPSWCGARGSERLPRPGCSRRKPRPCAGWPDMSPERLQHSSSISTTRSHLNEGGGALGSMRELFNRWGGVSTGASPLGEMEKDQNHDRR
jgi:hypothetical protein